MLEWLGFDDMELNVGQDLGSPLRSGVSEGVTEEVNTERSLPSVSRKREASVTTYLMERSIKQHCRGKNMLPDRYTTEALDLSYVFFKDLEHLIEFVKQHPQVKTIAHLNKVLVCSQPIKISQSIEFYTSIASVLPLENIELKVDVATINLLGGAGTPESQIDNLLGFFKKFPSLKSIKELEKLVRLIYSSDFNIRARSEGRTEFQFLYDAIRRNNFYCLSSLILNLEVFPLSEDGEVSIKDVLDFVIQFKDLRELVFSPSSINSKYVVPIYSALNTRGVEIRFLNGADIDIATIDELRLFLLGFQGLHEITDIEAIKIDGKVIASDQFKQLLMDLGSANIILPLKKLSLRCLVCEDVEEAIRIIKPLLRKIPGFDIMFTSMPSLEGGKSMNVDQLALFLKEIGYPQFDIALLRECGWEKECYLDVVGVCEFIKNTLECISLLELKNKIFSKQIPTQEDVCYNKKMVAAIEYLAKNPSKGNQRLRYLDLNNFIWSWDDWEEFKSNFTSLCENYQLIAFGESFYLYSDSNDIHNRDHQKEFYQIVNNLKNLINFPHTSTHPFWGKGVLSTSISFDLNLSGFSFESLDECIDYIASFSHLRTIKGFSSMSIGGESVSGDRARYILESVIKRELTLNVVHLDDVNFNTLDSIVGLLSKMSELQYVFDINERLTVNGKPLNLREKNLLVDTLYQECEGVLFCFKHSWAV